MSKLKCKLNIYSSSRHISLIITGYLMLQRQGIIDLEINFSPEKTETLPSAHMIEADINNEIKIAYDMLDGYNSNRNKVEEYLNNVDFYFKRSFSLKKHEDYKHASKIFPLGFYFFVTTKGNPLDNIKLENPRLMFKNFILNTTKSFHLEKFEDIPRKTKNIKILFNVGLWNPDENKGTTSQEWKLEREFINTMRIECIDKLRKEFGERFTGGIIPSEFTIKHYPAYVADKALTNRPNFMKLVKESDICLATMGLHKSNGGKLGEYIAASKAIISEKLHYEVTGDFTDGRNYLEFNNSDECVEKTVQLAQNKNLINSMKINNYNYYHNYLRPDRLVLNSLMQALEKSR